MTDQPNTELRDRVAALLEDRYTCTRVWEGWTFGTMRADDFIPASEDEELIEDLVALIDPAEAVANRAKLAELRALAMAHDGGRGGCVCQLCTAMGLGNVARELLAERMFVGTGGLGDWDDLDQSKQDVWLAAADRAVKDWVPIGYVDVVCDGPPGPESGRFVELENEQGASINPGEWIQREDGLWALRLPRVIWQ